MNAQLHSAEALNYIAPILRDSQPFFLGSLKVVMVTLTRSSDCYIKLNLFALSDGSQNLRWSKSERY
jgi:hypothetical protein